MNYSPQYELSGGGIENCFNLRIETTEDGERLQREAEARERAEWESKQREAKEQPSLI